MELKMINMKDIVTNPLQPRQEFNREKLQELADSIYESELLQPIVVRKVKTKTTEGDLVVDSICYEIVAGERRFKAFQILKEPKIPAIVRKIKDDTDALEKSYIENVQRVDLTSVEDENTVNELWESKRYKTQEVLAKKLGLSIASISRKLRADEIRDKFSLQENISTRSIEDTVGLSDEPRKKILESVSDGKIKADDVRDVVRKVKEFPEPEQQMEILEEFEDQEETSKEMFNSIVQKKKEIAEGKREPEHYVKIESDNDKRTIEDYYNIKSKVYDIVPIHIQYMKTKELQDEATQILWDIYKYAEKGLIALGRIQGVIDA